MTELVENLGNLQYDVLSDFLSKLAEKIKIDSNKDIAKNRFFLLKQASIEIGKSAKEIDKSWLICKKYM